MRAFILTAITVTCIFIAASCGSNTPAKQNTTADVAAANDTIKGKTENEIAAATNDTVRIANDSLEYEVIIIDPGFNSWLNGRARPRGYYGEPYLKLKNQFWITEWNVRINQPLRYGDLYLLRIDYDPQINYGYEVNYLLYNYLVYFQNTYNQRLGGIVPQF